MTSVERNAPTMFDLYGLSLRDLGDARTLVERALGILFVERDSLFHAGLYYRVRGETDFILQRNVDPDSDAGAEPNFREWPLLLYVDGSSRQDEIRAALERHPEIKFLRRKQLKVTR